MKFSEALSEYLAAIADLEFELSKSTPGVRAVWEAQLEITRTADQLNEFFEDRRSKPI